VLQTNLRFFAEINLGHIDEVANVGLNAVELCAIVVDVKLICQFLEKVNHHIKMD